MPHLRIRNLEIEAVLALSARLTDRLVAAIECERDWITIEVEDAKAIRDGASIKGNPFIEVLWFDRPSAVRVAVAKILSEELKGAASACTVVFRTLDPDGYFENGENV